MRVEEDGMNQGSKSQIWMDEGSVTGWVKGSEGGGDRKKVWGRERDTLV